MAPEIAPEGDGVLTCSFDGCKATFKRKDRLRSHLCTHEGSKPFKCPYDGCAKSYTNSAGLKRHDKRNHQAYNSDEDNLVHPCNEQGCSKVYQSGDALYKHIIKEHKKKCYQCVSCSKRFYKHQQLKIHEFEHTGIQPFACTHDGCDKRFLLPSRLKAHQKYHQGYTCKTPGCEKKFEKWTLLRKHVKLDHAPELKCERCSKVFRGKANLRQHLTTHEETRQMFVCPHDNCRSFFFSESNLKHHVSSSHEGKKYACTHPGCSKEFKHKITLKRHSKLHDPNAPLPEKKKLTVRKRRSMAAHLSGYKPSIEVDLPIITKDDEAFKERAKAASIDELPQVTITPCLDEKLLDTAETCNGFQNVQLNDANTKSQVVSNNKDDGFEETFDK